MDLRFWLHAAAAVVHLSCFGYGLNLVYGQNFDSAPPATKVVRRHYSYADRGSSGSKYYYESPPKEYESDFLSPLAMHTYVAIVTAVSHTVQAVRIGWNTEYLAKIDSGRSNWMRWAEYAVTATAITLANAAATGIMSFPLMSCMVTAGVVQQMVGYLLEKLRDRPHEHFVLFIMGSLLQTGITVFLIQRILPPSSTGTLQQSGTVVYGIFYALFGILAYLDVVRPSRTFLRGRKSADSKNAYNPMVPQKTASRWPLQYKVVDALYIVLSLTSKQALFWITAADGLGWIEPKPVLSHNIAAWVLGIAVPVTALICLTFGIIFASNP